jgi:hypothetical protein
MRKLCWLALVIIFGCGWTRQAQAIEPWEYSFILTATASASSARVTISWPAKDVPQIFVRRKLPADSAWGPAATLPGTATSYVDSTVAVGQVYEYEFSGVIEQTPYVQTAYGYIAAGANIPAVEKRGKVLLVVDNTHAAALATELEQLRLDLIGDGWIVVRRDVSPSATPPQVKALIKAEYEADPARMRSVFLFGHIPVPYSGKINPDMHPNHLGAWPADVYYGEMNGSWTDSTVNFIAPEYETNDNVPGDGKFDQSQIPTAVELEVGRVDMFGLPAFAASERELLRNYLRKNHAFRHRTTTVNPRGLIRDNFGAIDDDAPAVDAWRAFPALLGRGNYLDVGPDLFFSTLANNSYLFAYAGGGGDWDHADGVGSTGDFVTGQPKAMFFLLHGSYFGDWNNSDNFLRAPLAMDDYGLVSIWSSLPHWYFHHLALGETIGFATRLTQNNRSGLYRNQREFSVGEVHTSMMGDPTLRPFPLAPPSNFQVSPVGNQVNFTWSPSPQTIEGYNIYVAKTYDGPFVRLNRSIIPAGTTTASFTAPEAGHYIYALKASALQITGSGSFINLSQALFREFDSAVEELPQVALSVVNATGIEGGDPITFQFTRTGSVTGSLEVNLQYSGTATAGDDFAAPATLAFAAGSPTATLSLAPIADGINEFDETVSVTLAAGSGYQVIGSARAQGTIRGSGQSQITDPAITAGGAFTFRATGFANRNYRIESAAPPEAWHTISTGTSGADGSITYQDSARAEAANVWYRVVWE